MKVIKRKIIFSATLFVAMGAMSLISIMVGCDSVPLPEEAQLDVNAESLIIGETVIRVGSKSTYVLNVPTAKEHHWSFPNYGYVELEGYNLHKSTLTLKGLKEGKFRLQVTYKVGDDLETQEKYISVIRLVLNKFYKA